MDAEDVIIGLREKLDCMFGNDMASKYRKQGFDLAMNELQNTLKDNFISKEQAKKELKKKIDELEYDSNDRSVVDYNELLEKIDEVLS